MDEVQGRVPLLLGCGGNDTGSVCAFLEEADFEGIDGVLIVTPYYNKPTQEGTLSPLSCRIPSIARAGGAV